MMVMDIPAGMLAARWGDKAVMLLASVGLVVAFLGYATSTTITSFYIFALINSASSSTFLLGRMAYISDTLAGSERGRVIAMIAGSLRLAALLGPLAGGAAAGAVQQAEYRRKAESAYVNRASKLQGLLDPRFEPTP